MTREREAQASYIVEWYPLAKKFLSFSVVGIVATAIHYVVLVLLVHLLDVIPVRASSIGFVTSAVVNYLLNYHVTFRSQKTHIDSGMKFVVIAFLGLAVNALIMYMGTEMFRMHYLLTQVAATGLVLVWNFAGNYAWSFREHHQPGAQRHE